MEGRLYGTSFDGDESFGCGFDGREQPGRAAMF
jgi:hypothetical protein